jgi:hypothetical protein
MLGHLIETIPYVLIGKIPSHMLNGFPLWLRDTAMWRN